MWDRSVILRSVVVAFTYTMNVPGIHHGRDALGNLYFGYGQAVLSSMATDLVASFRLGRPTEWTVASIVIVLLLRAGSIHAAPANVVKVYTFRMAWFRAMLVGALANLEHDRLTK